MDVILFWVKELRKKMNKISYSVLMWLVLKTSNKVHLGNNNKVYVEINEKEIRIIFFFWISRWVVSNLKYKGTKSFNRNNLF